MNEKETDPYLSAQLFYFHSKQIRSLFFVSKGCTNTTGLFYKMQGKPLVESLDNLERQPCAHLPLFVVGCAKTLPSQAACLVGVSVYGRMGVLLLFLIQRSSSSRLCYKKNYHRFADHGHVAEALAPQSKPINVKDL